MRRGHRGALLVAVSGPRWVNDPARGQTFIEQCCRPRRKDAPIGGRCRALQNRVASWGDHLHRAHAIAGVERLEFLVAISSYHHRALLYGKANGAALGLPNGALAGVVAAVEEPGVGEVAVVCDLNVVRACPHKGADNSLWEEESISVTRLDPGDLHIGRYPHNADAILSGGNCARRMGAMSVVIHPGVRILVWDAPDARYAVSKVYIGR